jgi:signal transduction histidine kinase
VIRVGSESLRFALNFKRKVTAGLATALAVLLLVAALSYLSLAQTGEDGEWVTHTHLVLEKLDDIQTSLLDAETGERGYLIAAEDWYLSPFQRGRDAAMEEVKEVRALTADNPNERTALGSLEPLITAKLANLEEAMRSRKQKGWVTRAAAVREASGKELMDQIRLAIAVMKTEEDRLLVLRLAELKASSRRTRLVIIVGEALGFFFLLVAGDQVQKEMNKLAQAEAEVRTFNAELAERTVELAERAKELERSNMELQQFAYVASHDLQEPLRTISSFTQLLSKRYHDKLDEKAQEFIGFAVEGCQRMYALINDLLTFSRVGSQGQPLVPLACDAVLDRVLKSLAIAIEDSRAVITREPLPVVLADEMQLSQMFQNLVGNAIKFGGESVPRIHITCERNGKVWKIGVCDHGIGIAAEHKERIFVIFQRLHTKTAYAGTGIGLAICKKIAERHGGRIWVEPTEGGGSTFFFTMEDGEGGAAERGGVSELRISATAD